MMARTNSYASKAAPSDSWHVSVNEQKVVNARPSGDSSRHQLTPGVTSRQSTPETVTPSRSGHQHIGGHQLPQRPRQGLQSTYDREQHHHVIKGMRQSTWRGEICQKRREKLVIGNKTDDRLQSGSGRVTIIQYVRKQYENDDMKKYLNDENVNVDNIETVSLTKSFRVYIKYHDKSNVVSEDFWPRAIFFFISSI